jgi:hypothetical protein
MNKIILDYYLVVTEYLIITMSSNNNIKQWTSEIFNLSKSSEINVHEKSQVTEPDSRAAITEINILVNGKRSYSYIIEKPLSAITFDDILLLKNSLKKYAIAQHPFLAKFTRFFGWWFIFAGTFAAFSVCPVCGQVSCPVGVGTTGILAGVFALIKQNGRQFIYYIKEKIKLMISGSVKIIKKNPAK